MTIDIHNCYQINYDESLNEYDISKLGVITFKSKVLNMMIIRTKNDSTLLRSVKGVKKVIPTIYSSHKI